MLAEPRERLRRRRRTQLEPKAAARYGRRQTVSRLGGQDQQCILSRFLERLQERVGAIGIERLGPRNQPDFVAPTVARQRHCADEFANLIDLDLLRILLELHDVRVGMTVRSQQQTGGTNAARARRRVLAQDERDRPVRKAFDAEARRAQQQQRVRKSAGRGGLADAHLALAQPRQRVGKREIHVRGSMAAAAMAAASTAASTALVTCASGPEASMTTIRAPTEEARAR